VDRIALPTTMAFAIGWLDIKFSAILQVSAVVPA
jgi:hypothetical protein